MPRDGIRVPIEREKDQSLFSPHHGRTQQEGGWPFANQEKDPHKEFYLLAP